MKSTVSAFMITVILISMSIVAFDARPVEASETIYVRADGSIDPPTAPISTVDNVTYAFTDSIYDSIVVERRDIIIDGSGHTLQGLGSGNGFYWTGTNNVTLRNTNINGFRCGIQLVSSLHNSILGNNLSANENCIELHSSSDNILSGNIVENSEYNGIRLNSSSNNVLSGNNISAISGCSIRLYSSSNNTLSGNNMLNNYYGIYLKGSSGNTLSGNNIANNSQGYGIWLDSSHTNVLSGNNITASSESGIWLYSSGTNVLSDNNVASNHFGIFLQYSSGNTLSGNSIADNLRALVLYDFSNNNVAFHNSFIGGPNVAADSVNNVWDSGYPSGGNYWSDYAAVDLFVGHLQNETGSDGIGDTPYIIDTNNQDHYPLANPRIPGSPIAYFNHTPRFPLASQTVTFNASDSHDYEGNIISYEWNFGDGNITTLPEPIIAHVYTAEHAYSITLTVTDNEELRRSITRFIVLDATSPSIETPTREPTGDVLPDQPVKVSVNVTDATSGVENVTLYYTINDGETWIGLPMNPTTSNLYETMIPQQEAGVTARFKIVAYDHRGNNAILDGTEAIRFITNTSPLFGPGYTEEAVIGATIIIIAIWTAAYFLKMKKRKSKS